MPFYVNSVDIYSAGKHFYVQVNHCFRVTSINFWVDKLAESSSKHKTRQVHSLLEFITKSHFPKHGKIQRNKQSSAILILGQLRTAFCNSNPLSTYN
jgi:hypothetical protein